jgi:hypothetical protein
VRERSGLEQRTAADDDALEVAHGGERREVRLCLVAVAVDRQRGRVAPRERVGCGGAGGSGADRGDRAPVDHRLQRPVFVVEQQDRTLVRAVGRTVVAGVDRDDLDAEAGRLLDVARHQADEAASMRQDQGAPDRLDRALVGDQAQRVAHERNAALHRQQRGDVVAVEDSHRMESASGGRAAGWASRGQRGRRTLR